LAERRNAAKIRQFDTGATRDLDEGKLDYEAFESPLVQKRYAEYMHAHRRQPDGTVRQGDNWQKGIPLEAYMKSLARHFQDLRLHFDGFPEEAVDPDLESVLTAILFNTKGYLFEVLRAKKVTSNNRKAA
jgi:hypothetical protein